MRPSPASSPRSSAGSPYAARCAATWLWLRDQGLKFPLQPGAYVRGSQIIWTEPTYHAVHNVLTHPAYAGAYTFGRSPGQQRLARDGGRCGSGAACCRKTSGRC